ncbi:MAG: phosphoenolpyruvate carboxykinase (ATP) [Candidatus Shapirobacteria bacterium]|nr:phosphoenolpyruvate carboxykinase (ATP) [Candidatus Shapirobacteria bacterium]
MALARDEARLSKTGAVVVETGVYTGRSPEDRFIVQTAKNQKIINWGKVNQPISGQDFQKLNKKIQKYLDGLDQNYQTDGWVCADKKERISVRAVTEFAYQALFTKHILRKGIIKELESKDPDLTILVAPNLKANPKTDGTNSEAFIILNLEKRLVIIGGTKYAGEIKKSIFSYLNFILPPKKVFPMHCSANVLKMTV